MQSIIKKIQDMTKEKIEFFEKYAGMAIEQQLKYGIPASVTLAQAWWERGQAAENEKNMFGIKADPAWIKAGGKFGEYKDDEKGLSKFRSYERIEHSFEDQTITDGCQPSRREAIRPMATM